MICVESSELGAEPLSHAESVATSPSCLRSAAAIHSGIVRPLVAGRLAHADEPTPTAAMTTQTRRFNAYPLIPTAPA